MADFRPALSTVLVILLGMTTTYLLLFGLTNDIGVLVYPPPCLVQEWAVSLQHAVAWQDFLVIAGFVSALGILIGTLGATKGTSIFAISLLSMKRHDYKGWELETW